MSIEKASTLEQRSRHAQDILRRGLDRHRDGLGGMCSCGGCLAMHEAIRALKGDRKRLEPSSPDAPKGGET